MQLFVLCWVFLGLIQIEMEPETFKCNCCAYVTDNFPKFQYHYSRYHKHDPNFSILCCIGQCSYTSKTWGSYKVHLHRKHKDYIGLGPRLGADDNFNYGARLLGMLNENEDNEEYLDQLHANACFALSLEGKQHLGERSIDSIIDYSSQLIDTHLRTYRNRIIGKLQEYRMNSEIVDEVVFENSMENVSTASKRDAYYENNMSYIAPEEVVVGHRF